MTTNFYPGILLSINGDEVALSSKTVNGATDLLKKGITYELVQPVSVGSANDLSAFLTEQFGLPALPEPSKYPTPIKEVYEQLTGLVLGVEVASVTVPPTQNATGDALTDTQQRVTSFDIGISAKWDDTRKVDIIPGKLSVRGFYIRVVKDSAP